MLITRRIELGEYIVEIEYDDVTGAIEVSVLDELEGIIEYMSITNAEPNKDIDEDNEGLTNLDISLN
jgi:hypothetical protein